MPQIELSAAEIDDLLGSQRIVRVAFAEDAGGYLIPLGYDWRDGCLYLTLTRGRKTHLAEANPAVAFQVDDTAETGLVGWSSVTGVGDIEFVGDPLAAEEIARRVGARFPELAAGAESSARRAGGDLICARIRPRTLSGRKFTGFQPSRSGG